MEMRPGYKQTEVGVIPEDWDARTLLDLAEGKKELFDDGDWVEAEFLTDRGIRLIQTGNIGEGEFTDRDAKKYISVDSFKKLRCKDLQVGDILICRLAEPAGRACVLRDIGEDRMITAVDVTIFRPPAAVADRHFLVSVFTTPWWYQAVAERCGGSTRTRISRGELGKITVQLPPLTEQRAIAAALSDVDALLGELDRLIAKKRDLKQAAMQQLLTGQTRLPGFSGEWEFLPARHIGVFKGGSGFPLTAQGATSGEYPFFKVSDMNNEGNETFMTTANHYISEQTRKRLGATTFPAETIVFAKVGAAVFLERKKILRQASCIDNNIAAFVLDRARVDVRYVHFLLLSKKLGDLVATTALPALNAKQLGEMALAVPPLLEQAAIATVLSDMDAELAALEARRDKTRDLKQAMMQELLTGRTRLV